MLIFCFSNLQIVLPLMRMKYALVKLIIIIGKQQQLRMIAKVTKLMYRASKIKNFQNLDLLNQYLQVQKFPTNLVYFRAAWNPACLLTDQHIRQFSEKYPIEVVRVDSEVSPKILQHYGVRAEPEFVFCVYGDQVVRQIGPNYQGLIQKYMKIMQVQKLLEKNKIEWTKYGTKFQKFYKENLKFIYKH